MLTISPSSLPSNVTVGDPDKVTVTIVDNDGKNIVINFNKCTTSKVRGYAPMEVV